MAFTAKFPGRCRECNGPINKGDEIVRLAKQRHVHAKCATPEHTAIDEDRMKEWKANNPMPLAKDEPSVNPETTKPLDDLPFGTEAP